MRNLNSILEVLNLSRGKKENVSKVKRLEKLFSLCVEQYIYFASNQRGREIMKSKLNLVLFMYMRNLINFIPLMQ